MRIEEISSSLPNGFHDSEILNINLDYRTSTATVLFNIDLSDPENEVETSSRNGILTLNGLLYCLIEPQTYQFPNEYEVNTDNRMWITYDTSDFATLKYADGEAPPKLPEALPNGAFRHAFYSSNHNSYVYIAAMGASFEWVLE